METNWLKKTHQFISFAISFIHSFIERKKTLNKHIHIKIIRQKKQHQSNPLLNIKHSPLSFIHIIDYKLCNQKRSPATCKHHGLSTNDGFLWINDWPVFFIVSFLNFDIFFETKFDVKNRHYLFIIITSSSSSFIHWL